MLRSILHAIAWLGVFATTAAAQSNIDCGASYKAAIERFHKDRAVDLAPDKIADIHRLALRAYDACTAGDQFNARDYWEQVERWSSAKPEPK
jgi:hypothetical protein